MNKQTQRMLGTRQKAVTYMSASLVLAALLGGLGYALVGQWGLLAAVLPVLACFAKLVDIESQVPQSKQGYEQKLAFLLGASGAKKHKDRCLICGERDSLKERRAGSVGRLAMSCSHCKNIAYFIEKK